MHLPLTDPGKLARVHVEFDRLAAVTEERTSLITLINSNYANAYTTQSAV